LYQEAGKKIWRDAVQPKRPINEEGMMTNERRKSQRMAVKTTVDLMLAGDNGETFAGPVIVELNTFSLHGGSVVLPSMQAGGMHLFYGHKEQEKCCLMLRFVDGTGRSYMISCRPAWFDKELDADPAYYKLGFEFSRAKDRDNIKLLDRIARGKSEKNLFDVFGNLFSSRRTGSRGSGDGNTVT
jgi:hypothetical protein